MKCWKWSTLRDDGWVTLPSYSTWWCWKAKMLFFLEYWMFCSPNVTWYFITPWSFLAIRHAELQVKTGTQLKKLSLLTCLHVLPNPWRATNVGYAQAAFVTINYTRPCWGQEVGKDIHVSCWDLWASRAGWTCAGSVLGGGPGIPPTPASLAKAEIRGGWGWACLQGCLEKILRHSFIL